MPGRLDALSFDSLRKKKQLESARRPKMVKRSCALKAESQRKNKRKSGSRGTNKNITRFRRTTTCGEIDQSEWPPKSKCFNHRNMI